MADDETRPTEDTTTDLEDSGAEDQHEESAGENEGGETEPRTYTEEEHQAAIARATAAVQSTKDRRIASLEAQIGAIQAAEPIPQFRNAEEEIRWHRERVGRANAIRATEANIAAHLSDLSDRIGVEIKRGDERIDARTAESFETSLRAIEREETLRKQLPGKDSDGKPKPAARKDAHRYDGGSSGTRTTYDPKKFANTGNVYEALRARTAANGR